MIENPSFRYYLVCYQFCEKTFDVAASLEKILSEDNICKMDEGLFFVRSTGKGRNGEYIFSELKKEADEQMLLCVTTIGIRTILGQNMPEKVQAWADFEIELATPATT